MKAVDLGLSVYWGETLLEVPNKRYKECFFSWGDDSYNFAHKDRYDDYIDYDDLVDEGIINDSGCLSPQYDHACKILGEKWRMPTVEEFKELINKCKWIWNGEGYLVIGPSNNSIIIPYVKTFHDSGWKKIEDIWYLGEIEKPIMIEETKCFWSSEPSYDLVSDGMTTEAYVLCAYNPESSISIRVSSDLRSKENFIIPVTSERSFI